MGLFGYSLVSQKTLELKIKQTLNSIGIGSWTSMSSFMRGLITETSPGGWQRNDDVSLATVFSHPTVFRCVGLIQSDLGKMRLMLLAEESGVNVEIDNPAYSPVLRKPNHFQTRQQFIETWVNSKLVFGNTYVLKRRDQRGVVIGLYVLDPSRVTILGAPDGSLFYELHTDDIASIRQSVRVPAREMIHDRMPALFHPLFGVSPLYAAAGIALHGLNIHHTSNVFQANGAHPGGLVTYEKHIPQDAADRIKNYWQTEFGGDNAGKVAVLGDNAKYLPVEPMKAVDTQLIEQQNWIDEKICSCFGMPPHKVGVGDQPNYNNIEALNQQYWSECLQHMAEAIQTLLIEGLDARPYLIRLDKTDLLRMDTATMVKAASEGIRAGFLAPNEARRIFFDLPPVEGGDTPYMQHQDYSLGALARRDAENPAPSGAPEPNSAKQIEVIVAQPDTANYGESRGVFQKTLMESNAA